MSKAVTSGSALVGPTEPSGVGSGWTFAGGGSGGGEVCWTLEGGVDADEMEGCAGATGVGFCAWATGTKSRAIKAKEVKAKRKGIGMAPAAVRAQ